MVGCKRESTDNQSSTQTESSQTARDDSGKRDATATTPTSRDETSPTRVYSGDTNTAAAKQPDNAAVNVRDRSGETLTPGDQGGTEADREITRQIRRALTANDQLSTVAKNIKIITLNGKVTLRGPVKNEQEKQAITSAAQSAAGVAALDDQLEIKTQ
jgi:osmotically-inducible protein OsmY